jgi:hypothetical protein
MNDSAKPTNRPATHRKRTQKTPVEASQGNEDYKQADFGKWTK